MTQIKPAVNNPDTMSDRELLEGLAGQIESLIGQGERHARQLDHIDTMVHTLGQQAAALNEFIEEHRGALDRALGLLDTGAKFRGFLGGKGKS